MRTRHRFLALATALLIAACDSTTPAPPRQEPDATALQPLLDRLDRLIAVMQSKAASASARTPLIAAPLTETAREPVPTHASELESRIAALERQLRDMHRQTASRATVSVPGMQAPVKLDDSVAQLEAQLKAPGTRQEARRSLFLIHQADALRRFGMPDSAWVNDKGHQQWSWHSDPEAGFTLTFVDGVAVQIEG